MAQEYVAIKENNNDGVIALSTSTFQTIAKIVIEEDEHMRLADTGAFKYPMSCKVADDQLILSINIKVKYGVNVNDTCSKVQGKIFENIEHMTGYTPDVIDIHVSGFMF